jgi:hypothetical protein
VVGSAEEDIASVASAVAAAAEAVNLAAVVDDVHRGEVRILVVEDLSPLMVLLLLVEGDTGIVVVVVVALGLADQVASVDDTAASVSDDDSGCAFREV